jgi:hypothetical protein
MPLSRANEKCGTNTDGTKINNLQNRIYLINTNPLKEQLGIKF